MYAMSVCASIRWQVCDVCYITPAAIVCVIGFGRKGKRAKAWRNTRCEMGGGQISVYKGSSANNCRTNMCQCVKYNKSWGGKKKKNGKVWERRGETKVWSCARSSRESSASDPVPLTLSLTQRQREQVKYERGNGKIWARPRVSVSAGAQVSSWFVLPNILSVTKPIKTV